MPYYTAQDAVDYIITGTGGGAQDGEHRVVRAAVHHAYRQVAEGRNWLWHVKTGEFYTTGGTFAVYNHTPGSPNLLLPPNCNLYISVGDSISTQTNNVIPGGAVISAISPTTTTTVVNGQTITVRQVTLSLAPTGGTPITSVFVPTDSDYPLPEEVKDMDALLSQTVGTLRFYVTPTDYLRMQINASNAGDPFYFTVMRIGSEPHLSVRFVGVPTAQLQFQYVYRKRPTPLSLMGYEPSCRDGTVSVAANSTTVTGSGGANFSPRMVGCVIRFSKDNFNYPESLSGLYPYAEEAIIAAVPNSSTLTLSEPVSAAYTNVKYYISDVLDVSPGMYTAVLSGAEMWYARLSGRPAEQPLALFQRDMRLAMETDVTNPYSGRREGWLEYPLTPRLAGYYSQQLPDQGT